MCIFSLSPSMQSQTGPHAFGVMASHVLCLSPGSCQDRRHSWMLGSTERKDLCLLMCQLHLAANDLQTTMYSYFLWFWGLTGLRWVVLAQELSWNCSEMLAGTRVIRHLLAHISGSWDKIAGKMGSGQASLWLPEVPHSMAVSDQLDFSCDSRLPQKRAFQEAWEKAVGFFWSSLITSRMSFPLNSVSVIQSKTSVQIPGDQLDATSPWRK